MRKKILFGLLIGIIVLNIIVSGYIIIRPFVALVDFLSGPSEIVTEEMLTEIFEENKESFNDVAEEMFTSEYRWRLTKKAYMQWFDDLWDFFVNGETFAYAKGGIRIHVNEIDTKGKKSPLKSVVKKNIHNIGKIMNELNFVLIQNTHHNADCIYFFIDSDMFYSVGLIYCPEGTPEDPYFIKLTKLDNCWYYFEKD